MIELSKEQLDQLHKVEIEILDEIDRICKKHKIQYFIAGGTLLGAVRHQGFIPWDDDIDLYMFRPHYERFCMVCQEELDHARFFWQTQETDAYYRWTYGKMRRKGTLYLREGQEHMKFFQGIFVDVLPFDKRSERKVFWKIQTCLCKLCRSILWAPVGSRNEQKRVRKFCYKLLNYFSRDFAYKLYKKVATFYNKTSSHKYFSFNVNWKYPYDDGIDETWIQQTVNLNFENKKYPAPQKYHDFLRFYYGNYMKYPPINERRGVAPSVIIKFLDEQN